MHCEISLFIKKRSSMILSCKNLTRYQGYSAESISKNIPTKLHRESKKSMLTLHNEPGINESSTRIFHIIYR